MQSPRHIRCWSRSRNIYIPCFTFLCYFKVAIETSQTQQSNTILSNIVINMVTRVFTWNSVVQNKVKPPPLLTLGTVKICGMSNPIMSFSIPLKSDFSSIKKKKKLGNFSLHKDMEFVIVQVEYQPQPQ